MASHVLLLRNRHCHNEETDLTNSPTDFLTLNLNLIKCNSFWRSQKSLPLRCKTIHSIMKAKDTIQNRLITKICFVAGSPEGLLICRPYLLEGLSICHWGIIAYSGWFLLPLLKLNNCLHACYQLLVILILFWTQVRALLCPVSSETKLFHKICSEIHI